MQLKLAVSTAIRQLQLLEHILYLFMPNRGFSTILNHIALIKQSFTFVLINLPHYRITLLKSINQLHLYVQTSPLSRVTLPQSINYLHSYVPSLSVKSCGPDHIILRSVTEHWHPARGQALQYPLPQPIIRNWKAHPFQERRRQLPRGGLHSGPLFPGLLKELSQVPL